MMDLGLKGRTALVTGGSRGIGLAVAGRLVAEGCAVHLAARSADRLAEAREALSMPDGPAVKTHVADLADPAVPPRLAADCGRIDILVNNAGAIPPGSIDRIDDAVWRRAWDLKVFGFINMTREFLSRMRERRTGVIVNVIGAAGERPDAAYIAGAAGNAGLMAFTRALGAEAIRDGVRVVGVNPGLVGTERMVSLLQAKAADTLGDSARWEELVANFPLGRPCRPEEIADMVAFLASDRAGYVSGTIVTVDGGMSARGASF